MSCQRCMFVAASLVLTGALLAVGMSFFAPYWLSNIPAVDESSYTGSWCGGQYIDNSSIYSDRGLWAQCGAECRWFWNANYQLQICLLTPLKWHLATQVLYFIGAVLLLTGEIFARAQLCCEKRSSVYYTIAAIVLTSALIQLGAIATFGGGAARNPYNAISNPTWTTPWLGHAYNPAAPPSIGPYLGWCFWMAVVGDILSVIAGCLFVLCGCCQSRKY